MKKEITFIDLFAGIGGIRLAFERNSMRCVFSSEWDKFAQQTYFENFKEMPKGDITKISTDDIPNHNILTGGFPCQPFSSIGKRQGFSHKTQGNLFFEIVRILKAKEPRAFMLENVLGIKTINNGETFKAIMEELRVLGYKVTFLELDSKDYGVPQKRVRVYFVGFLTKTASFNYIEPEIKPEFISKFIEKDIKGYDMSDSIINNYLFKKDDGRPEIVDENSDIQVKTLVSTYHKIQRLTGTFVRDTGRIRLLSENECKAIMGFPKDFKFPVSRTQMYRQMGNSVAVPVVEDIAKQMKEFLIANDKSI